MKILVPVNQKSEDAQICEQFGRAPFFAIIENEKLIKIIENPASLLSKGAGSKAAQFALEKKVDKIILKKEPGPHAKEVLEGEVDIEINPNIEFLRELLN